MPEKDLLQSALAQNSSKFAVSDKRNKNDKKEEGKRENRFPSSAAEIGYALLEGLTVIHADYGILKNFETGQYKKSFSCS